MFKESLAKITSNPLDKAYLGTMKCVFVGKAFKKVAAEGTKFNNNNKQLPKNALLVTWDVKSLYTSIPHKDGLEALKKTLKEEENVNKSKATTILTKAKPQQY